MNGDSFNKTTFYFHGAFLDLKAALRGPWRYSEIKSKKNQLRQNERRKRRK